MSTDTPSPVSNESNSTEGTVLREFVDQAIAQKRLATMSPRSAILSHTSLQTPTADEPSTVITNDAVDSGRQVRKRTADSRRKRGGMDVARPSALSQLVDVDLSRKNPTEEVMRLRHILKTVEQHSIAEARRAKELERANQETEKRLRALAETRMLEQKETAKAQQEVRLVQLQLHNAQEEIDRKQREMKRIEGERDKAEAQAIRERERARKLHEQTIAAAAREEGRRRGFQDGFDYAQQERRMATAAKKSIAASKARRIAARRPSTVESNSNSPHSSEKAKGKQRARDDERIEPDIVTHRSASGSRPQTHTQTQSQYSQPQQRSRPQAQSQYSYSQSQSQSQVAQQSRPTIAPLSEINQILTHDYEMSPSQLPLRGLPALDSYSDSRPSRPPPSHSTPRRKFPPPPPEFDSETEEHIPRATLSSIHANQPPSHRSYASQPPPNQVPSNQPPPNQFPPNQPPSNQPSTLQPPPNQHPPDRQQPPNWPAQTQPPRNVPPMITKTPSIQVYEIEIPSPEQLSRQYNNSQESADIARQIPRDQWVTASTYHQRRGAPVMPAPRQAMPRPVLKPIQMPRGLSNLLKRPSLPKSTSSWYRSLSFRKKTNKPVVDPIVEEPHTPPTSGGPMTGSTDNGFQPPTGHSQRFKAHDTYGDNSQQPPPSWYQPRQPSVPPSAPVSVRSGYSRMRAISDAASVSTRVSQFDLLSTPHIPPAMSVRSGKDGNARVREKESLLSVIKEDPASRGNTPERYGAGASMGMSGPRASADNMRSMASVLSQPNLNYGQRPIQQQASVGTYDSSNQNKRRSRRPPPSIEVPDPDQELEPFGVAYNRGAAANGYQQYPYQGSSLHRRPSRISEKTTPDTSIGIDVIPPSAIAPDAVQSPPHTGRNHLSPYHSYQPAAPAFKQSVQSLRSQGQGSTRREPQPVDRPPSAADSSRRHSRQNTNHYNDPSRDQYQPSPSMSNVQPRPPSAASRSASNNPYGDSNAPYTYSYTAINESRSPGRRSPYQARPESIRSTASKKPYGSQTSLNNITATGSVMGQPKNASSSRLVLATPIHRAASNASLRSQGSYSKYDPREYVDPAYWNTDGIPPAPPAIEPQVDSYFDERIPPRQPSTSPGLSYVSE